MDRWEQLKQGLHIAPNIADRLALLRGRAVLLVDDNVTDAVTYVAAERLMVASGASAVGLVTLTRTIRLPQDLQWALP